MRLADEDYCRELLSTGATLAFQFDGLRPEAYTVLRGNADILPMKLKALENIRKYARSQIALSYTIGRGINDSQLSDFFDFCHERRDFIGTVHFVPLAKTWDNYDVDVHWVEEERLTVEDVEKLISDNLGETVEFLPAGALSVPAPLQWIEKQISLFEGVHPNCESVAFMISTGSRYASVSRFMKASLFEMMVDVKKQERRMSAPTHQATQTRRRLPLPLTRVGSFIERSVHFAKYGFIFLRHFDFTALFKGQERGRLLKFGRLLSTLPSRGNRMETLKKVTGLGPILRLLVVPYQDHSQHESCRLERCRSAMAFVDPDTDSVNAVPLCTWNNYRNELLPKIAGVYEQNRQEPFLASAQEATDVSELAVIEN